MKATPLCPSCGKPLAVNAPKGLCPECLIKGAFLTGTEPGQDPSRPRFVPPQPDELTPHFPQLDILEFIGQGGMGAVYKARQKELDRIVALKILPPGIGEDASFAERFAREAKALARLNHPNIVTLFEFGRADGLFFFLMEFVDGVTMRQLLNASRISSREALAIVPQICDALQFAHDQGIVHRDIKPENILIDRRGRVKVADFGLAKLVGKELASGGAPARGGALPESSLTESGKIMGTPTYMAPEQLEHPAEVDHRADIYALGVVFYQMLTGELPGRKLEAPSSKVHIDVRLDEIVLRALATEPERRYQHASVLKSDVETVSVTPATSAQVSGVGSTVSGTAVAGACLAPFFFLSMMFWDFGGLGGLEATIGVLVSALGLIAILGTTILGWLSIGQIRRSAGRLGGLGLALCDALLLPLLLLDFLGMMALLLINRTINVFILSHFYPQLRESMALNLPHMVIILVIVTSFVVWMDYAIVRFVWRKANTPLNGSSGMSAARFQRRTGERWKMSLGIGAMALTILFTFMAAHHYRRNKDFYIGQAYFPGGDFIKITSVEHADGQMTVKGIYELVSADQAQLALYITSTNTSTGPEDPRQTMRISKGRGAFELTHPHIVPGMPHVSMYSTNGAPFAALYFGNKAEALQERRMNLAPNP